MKYDEDLKTNFLEHLRQWGRVGLATRSVGLSPQTIARRRKNFPEFDKDITEALAFNLTNVPDIFAKQRAEAEKKGYWEMADRTSVMEAYQALLSSK